MNHSVSQPTKLSINHPINQLINQSINQSINTLPINREINDQSIPLFMPT